ncbi:pentatricopeptide repeat-containing protein At3g05340 [Andrographis paniculata]|uniref:pentatricopeptide repeat-containing protein At3g05340 n=1 Tax=Andrographis paniculata TaxID=175694 RepID=UPI0021E8C96F|nr:pentatricopeptide repeat-containing protein At3g05340 [Andrographis paniculata]
MSGVQYLFSKLTSPWRPLPLHPWRRRGASLILSFSTQTSLQTPSPPHLRFLLLTCIREGNLRSGSSIHARIIKSPPFTDLHNPSTNVICNSLLHMYCKSGRLPDALKVFDDMPLRDTVSYNSLISGLLKLGHLRDAFGHFKTLLGCNSCWFDHASLTSILSACGGGSMAWLGTVKMIHALAISNGYGMQIAVGNALITSYFRCRSFESGMRLFHEVAPWRNVVTWTAVISGLAQNEFYIDSINLFVEMWRGVTVSPNRLTYLSAITACSGLRALEAGSQIHGVVWKLGFQSDVCVESALMDMYAKCGCVEAAWRIFESAEIVDKVSLTVILAGLAQNGFEREAIKMFAKIVNSGVETDPNMISAILGVSGVDTSQTLGAQIHSSIVKNGFSSNVYVANGLINMYSKCGELRGSVKIFESMHSKTQISWNSIIAAHARHGDGREALRRYDEMRSKGVEPTDVTFLSLLHACSHVGLLHKGTEFLQTMETRHGLRPRTEHYACMVDMLGRAGLSKEAKDFVDRLPVKPDALIWQALLGACRICGDVGIGKYAAARLAEAEPCSPMPYIAMANIYSSRERWRERATTMRTMKEKKVAKETGISWIEVDKEIHSFVVDDRIYNDYVCEIVAMLYGHMNVIDDQECIIVS